MKRNALQAALLAAVMGVVSMPHTVLAADAPSEAAAAVNTWIGYQLRDDAGQYLTVANGAAETGSRILSYAANGVAAYNIWYFTETGTGTYTLKSSLSEGEFYATASDRQTLELQLQQDGMQQQFTCTEVGMNRIHLQQNETDFGTYTLEPVTWLKPGDVNRDGVVNVLDLALAKRLILQGGSSDFYVAALADVDGNGTLDAADLAALQGFLMQRQTAFPAETVTLPENTIFPVVEPEQTTTTTSITTTTTAPEETTTTTATTTTTDSKQTLTIADMPASYQSAADWIWTNRVEREQSTVRRNTLFDQIIAGKGELHYVVRWQSYKTVSLEQRKQFEKLVEDSINAWTDWLKDYEDWPYDHITVKIVGWAVLDRNCLLDLQPDEVVYDSLISDYDSSGDTSNGHETIPDKLPSAPTDLSRMEHFMDTSYVYPGERFDMYLWATQGFPSIGGCGGDWGQRLSDDAYLNMLDGTGLHVLEHELGHGFGMTDFYGGEGELDGFPPGGFPGGSSLMMAGSSMQITDFDGWMLRYFWDKIHLEEGRFSY